MKDKLDDYHPELEREYIIIKTLAHPEYANLSLNEAIQKGAIPISTVAEALEVFKEMQAFWRAARPLHCAINQLQGTNEEKQHLFRRMAADAIAFGDKCKQVEDAIIKAMIMREKPLIVAEILKAHPEVEERALLSEIAANLTNLKLLSDQVKSRMPPESVIQKLSRNEHMLLDELSNMFIEAAQIQKINITRDMHLEREIKKQEYERFLEKLNKLLSDERVVRNFSQNTQSIVKLLTEKLR